MNSQEIQNIKIEDLVLWTENPRDPISSESNNQDVANRALQDKENKWNLSKLVAEMGDFYDYSEIPTVVMEQGKPVVYDGNRRVLLGKIKSGEIVVPEGFNIDISLIPTFPAELPCNVCDRKTALKSVIRKHSTTGTWDILGRDIFMNKYMNEPKSTFLTIEEYTGIISSNPCMNQRFVKDEVLIDRVLNPLGVKIESGKLYTNLTEDGLRRVLQDIVDKISSKSISTRSNRYHVVEALDETTKRIVDKNKTNPYNEATQSQVQPPQQASGGQSSPRLTKRTKRNELVFLGDSVALKAGDVNNLYRDIRSLGEYYSSNKDNLSGSFPALLRMALRLLIETAARDESMNDFNDYVQKYFDSAKKLLSKDEKTTLSNNSVDKTSMPQLLHTGAHNYQSSLSYDKAYAMSLIIGKMLSLSHKKI